MGKPGCRDCKKCTNSMVTNFFRNTGRFTTAISTVGMSEAGLATRKKCRICGHQLSLHKGAESERVQPAVEVKSPPPAQPVAPAGPPAGWYVNPQDRSTERWWDGSAWTEHLRTPGG